MQIQVVNVEISTKPTAKSSYQIAEVAYKNLATGKLEGKKIMSFTNKEVFSEIAAAKSGEVFDVTSEKDEKGYWQWTAVKRQAAGAAPAPANKGGAVGMATTSPKSTYETPEERAKKQIYIVRQSSLSSAIDLLSVGAKTAPDVGKVVEVAKQFEDFVFGVGGAKQADLGSEMMLPPDKLDDDIPF